MQVPHLSAGALRRRFSDNAFLLLPWEPKTITFTSGTPFSLSALQSSTTVMSIADTMPGAQNTKPLDPPEMTDYSINTLDWVQVSTLTISTLKPFMPCQSVLQILSGSCYWFSKAFQSVM